jgi:hypothetical protein
MRGSHTQDRLYVRDSCSSGISAQLMSGGPLGEMYSFVAGWNLCFLTRGGLILSF